MNLFGRVESERVEGDLVMRVRVKKEIKQED